MEDGKKGGFSLVIGMGKPKKGGESEEPMDSKAQAGKALAAAIKGGDGSEIAEAFQMMLDECDEGGEGDEEESENPADLEGDL